MTISRAQMLHEMGLSPQWKLRDNPSVLRGAQSPTADRSALADPPAALPATAGEGHLLTPGARTVVSPPADHSGQIAGLGWDELARSVADCRACGLCAERQQAVLGVGDLKADWLFIGEGPGSEEDARGEPFVGQAGALLDAMLAAIDLQRGADVYITNAIKCHPPGNRTPEAGEIDVCAPYLRRQIALLQPKVIVLLGRVAVYAVLGEAGLLSSLRGKPFEYRDGERSLPVVVTYHPAYLLRTLPDKAKTWEDLCRARHLMREAKALALANSANVAI